MFSRHFTRLVTLAVVAVLAFALAPAMPERAHAAGGVLAYGDVVNGQIDNVNYFELWEFSGTKGDHIQLLMEGDGKLDPYLGIIESTSEQVLAEDDDSGGNSNAYIEMTLPSTGTFSVVATRYNFDAGDSQGKYTLSLAGSGTTQTASSGQPTTTTEPVELEAGVWYMGDIALAESVSGSIDQNAYAQIYSVNLEAGTELVVVMFADGSTVDPYVIFMTEDGDVLAEDDDSGAQLEGAGKSDALLYLTVEQTGLYFIVATRAGVEQGASTGAYALLAVIPEPEEPAEPEPDPASNELPPGMESMGMIEVGQQGTATISADSYFHIYGFDAQAGQQVTITMRGSGGLDAYLGLMDLNDEVIAEDDDSGGGTDAQISIRIPESGTYVIVATRNGIDAGTTAGSYTLEVTDGTPQPATGQTGIGGFGGLPGRAFEVEGETFYLRGYGASDDPAKSPPVGAFTQSSVMPGRSNPLDSVRGRYLQINFYDLLISS